MVGGRAGRVRELTRSFRPKFKMVWHHFSAYSSVLYSPSLLESSFSSVRGTVAKCFRSVQFSLPSSCHEVFRKDAGPESEPPVPAHFGRSVAVGTFCSEPEPEPSKKVSTPAPKERKNLKKENAKCETRKRRIHHLYCSVPPIPTDWRA